MILADLARLWRDWLAILPDWLMWLLGLFAAVVPILGYLTALYAVSSRRSGLGKVAWVVALVGFPWLSLPLFLVAGRNRFAGYVQARRTSSRRNDLKEAMQELRGALAQFRVDLISQKPRTGQLRALEKVSGLPMVRGNALELYTEGEAAFDAMICAINGAQETVLVEFFIVRDDVLGHRFADALIKRAQAGVRVCFLYDEFGSIGLDRSFRRKLSEGGVNMSKFGGRRRPLTERFQLNFRNHRKIVVVDDRAAFLGGLNVGLEYLGSHPKLGQWRDTHLQIRGPSVEAVELIYMEDWLWATGEVLELPCRPLPEQADDSVLIVPTGPADTLPAGQQLFLQLIEAAKERIWIATPYFVPDGAVLSALQAAALRGVEVRLLLPSVVDKRIVYWASCSYYPQLENFSVEVWRYEAGFLHQKVVLVDDDLALVGTANLDYRSLFLNFEISALVREGPLPLQVAKMLEADFAKARKVDLQAEWKKKGFRFRLACNLSRLLEPVL